MQLFQTHECSICYEELKEHQTFLSCGHSFHYGCVHAWYSCGTRTCPLCRCRQTDEEDSDDVQQENHIIDYSSDDDSVIDFSNNLGINNTYYNQLNNNYYIQLNNNYYNQLNNNLNNLINHNNTNIINRMNNDT